MGTPRFDIILADQPPFLPGPRKLVPCKHVVAFTKPECPYCGGQLTAQAEEWTQEPSGIWLASSISVDCDTEPDIQDPTIEEWLEQHSFMPYSYMLPLEQRMLKYIRGKYQYEMPDNRERT